MGGAGKVRVEVVSCAHLIAYCGGGFRVFKGFFFKRFASEYPARRKSNSHQGVFVIQKAVSSYPQALEPSKWRAKLSHLERC